MRMVLFFIIWYKKYVPSISSGTNAVRAQRVLRACGTRLAPTEPEARPQVQILSHRLIVKVLEMLILQRFQSFFKIPESSQEMACGTKSK